MHGTARRDVFMSFCVAKRDKSRHWAIDGNAMIPIPITEPVASNSTMTMTTRACHDSSCYTA